MCESKCLLSALIYFLAQLVVVVLKPLCKLLGLASEKCAAVAARELAKIGTSQVAEAPKD